MGLALSTTAEAIRAYIVELRRERHVTIDALADAIDMPRRTYIEWEQGRTKDIKAPFVIRAIRFLHGSIAHLEQLDKLTAAEASELARRAAAMSDTELDEAIAILERLRDDPPALARWLGYGEALTEEQRDSHALGKERQAPG